jgi:hypothetical protein
VTTQLYAAGGGAVTVRNPDTNGFKRVVATTGGSWRALDGTLRQHYTAVKYRWTLKWTGLTSAEYATLLAEIERVVPMTFKPPDTATTYTVLRIGDVEGDSDGFSYHISGVLEQV